MEGNTITLDKETFKALAVETRLDILKLLAQKQLTLTDIAEKLSMSHSTIKQHLDVLKQAGLLKVEDTDRKWKYYYLTWKGRRVAQPHEVKVMFTLVFGLLLLVVGVVGPFAHVFTPVSMVQSAAVQDVSGFAELAQEEAAPLSAKAARMPQQEHNEQRSSLYFFALAFIGAMLASFSFGWFTKKQPVIVGGKKQ